MRGGQSASIRSAVGSVSYPGGVSEAEWTVYREVKRGWSVYYRDMCDRQNGKIDKTYNQ
jgi:hypothetical protein